MFLPEDLLAKQKQYWYLQLKMKTILLFAAMPIK